MATVGVKGLTNSGDAFPWQRTAEAVINQSALSVSRDVTHTTSDVIAARLSATLRLSHQQRCLPPSLRSLSDLRRSSFPADDDDDDVQTKAKRQRRWKYY